MNEMTLPSEHMIQNSSPGGLWSKTSPLGRRGFPRYCIIENIVNLEYKEPFTKYFLLTK